MYYRIANDTACKWCQSQQASSNHWRDINFARHTNCKCVIINTNEGTLDSGTKKGKWNREYFSVEEFQEELNKSLNNVVKTTPAKKEFTNNTIPKAKYRNIDESLIKEIIEEVIKNFKKETKTDLSDNHILIIHVSKAARKSNSEAFAELFAKVMNNDDDLITKLFKDSLKKRGY